jgi:hypothetical protein
MAQNSITVQLIRDSNNSKRDDLVTIKPTGYDTVRMVFKDRDNNSEHTLDMSRSAVSTYFLNLFDILSYDKEPYEAVQVNFPGFPCTYMSQKDFIASSARERMQSLLWFALDNSFPAIVTEREEAEANAY